MNDILIRFSQMEQLKTTLTEIIAELNDAGSRQNDLERAIGAPFGKFKLRNLVHDFEGQWNDKRDDLIEGLEGVEKHVQGVIEQVQEWDTETEKSLSKAS